MKKTNKIGQGAVLSIWLTTMLSLTACGGSDGNSEEGIRGKRLSDLGAPDEAEYCDEVGSAKTTAMVDSFWRWDCASTAQNSQACDVDEITACADGYGPAQCDLAADQADGDFDCNATVGEFADCLAAYYGQFLQFADADCDTDTSISLILDATELAQCDALEAKCAVALPNF